MELLRWRSQESNVRLRALAEQLLVDVRTVARDDNSLPSREMFDQLLLTAHQRAIAKDAQDQSP
jgi:hypothetical protein